MVEVVALCVGALNLAVHDKSLSAIAAHPILLTSIQEMHGDLQPSWEEFLKRQRRVDSRELEHIIHTLLPALWK